MAADREALTDSGFLFELIMEYSKLTCFYGTLASGFIAQNCAPYSVHSLSLFSKEHEWVMNDRRALDKNWVLLQVSTQVPYLCIKKETSLVGTK